MTNEQIKQLCTSLMTTDSEDEVIRILTETGYWSNPDAWRFYGDNENNFSTIGNQQSRPDAALVEKLINCVDHRLLNECLVRGFRRLPSGWGSGILRSTHTVRLSFSHRNSSLLYRYFMFGPSVRSKEPTMPSADFCQLFRPPLDGRSSRQADRSPRVIHSHLPAYARRIYVQAFRTGIGL
ncbi:hypothetical protein BH20ACI2_BH20ACI2_10940 [soil metagenome]